MNKIRIFLISVCCLTITTCKGQQADLKAFLDNFKQIEFPVTFDNGPIKNNTELFKKGFKRAEFLKFRNGIKEYTTKDTYFYYGGKAKCKELNILIYRITNFGDAPALDTIKIELVVFNSQWKMLSKMVIGGQETEDKLINCVLNQDMTFVVSILNSSNKLIRKQKYFIDVDGKIKKQS